jgi:tetratricopeptide (TPR) repeat protein
LHQYLDELASHYHATAQAMQHDLVAAGTNNTAQQQKTHKAFLTASGWYAEFAETFPDDEKTPGIVFLMAESLHEAGEYSQAIDAYERVAYDDRDPARGADAAYYALIAYDQQLASLSGPGFDSRQGQKIDSELLFAETYPSDPRKWSVLTQAAEEYLQTGNAREAITTAARVTGQQADADPGLLRTAWLVQGQGNFQLANYAAAERTYSSALLLMRDDDEAGAATLDRLAASVYKQAEAHLAAADNPQAIDDFLRVASVAAGSSIAVKAHYDGANRLMELESWERAEQELNKFRRSYPQHPLAITIPAKLVHIHKQQGHWRQAGDELTLMATYDDDPEVRRQSLYMAAEFYEKDHAMELAVERYTEYARS